VTYSVHLGLASVPPLVQSTPGFSYEACCLNYGTAYYWQITATDNHGAVTPGPLARFTTRGSPWFPRVPMPLARKFFATAMANNRLYVIGGQDEGNNATGTVQEYDPALNAWNIRSSMPTARYCLAADTAGGRIYAVGGKNGNDSVLGATEEYDPASDTWTAKRPLIVPRWSLAVHSVNGLVYAVGGFYKAPSGISMVAEIFYPAQNKWVKPRILPRPGNFPPPARLYTMSGVISGMICIAGGYDPWENSFSDRVDVFVPATVGWSRLTPLLRPRSNGLGVVANGCFYVIGGYNGNYLRRVEKYDPGTGLWAQRGDMLNSRSGCGGSFHNNSIFVVGGINPSPVYITEEYQTWLDP
jgi:N-acetylneuraminic acid mutarotase